MGFNNAGAGALAARLERCGRRGAGTGRSGIPLGISIGKTKTTPLAEATADYLTSLRTLAAYADYVAVNVSSPNTPGLRALQDADALRRLLGALVAAAAERDPRPPVPVLVKVAPDLSEDALEEVLAVCADAGASGLIATNTTLARDGLAPADRRRRPRPAGCPGRRSPSGPARWWRFLAARTAPAGDRRRRR